MNRGFVTRRVVCVQPAGALVSSPLRVQGWRSLLEHTNTAESGQMCAAGGAVLVCAYMFL